MTANAVTASMTGSARRTMHGSWRPFIESFAGFIVARSTESCSMNTVGVGRIATVKQTGFP